MLDKLFLAFLAILAPAALAADIEQQRAVFLQAEQALNQGYPEVARQKLDGLAGYPLQPYLLSRILSAAPATSGEIPAFLESHGGTRYAEPLRKKWLDRLAQRESWAEYVRYYRDTDNTQARCHFYRALHELGRLPEAYAGAARLWATGEALPAACDPLLAAWQATPEFTEEQVWQRFGAALDKNRVDLASALRPLVPDLRQNLADLWIEVHNNPQRVEQCLSGAPNEPLYGRIFAHGIDRLAAQDPLRAQSLWNLRRSEFRISPDEQARIDRRLGLALATGRYPEATAYLGTLAEGAGDGQTRVWRVRSALWKEDWPGALIALGQLAPGERNQAAWRYWRARSLESLDEDEEAAGIYRQLAGEREFYGFIAADRVGRDYGLSFPTEAMEEAELQRLAESGPFGAVREFRALNRPGEAQKEWMHAIEALPRRDLALAAHLAERWGWHRLAILTATKAGLRDDLSLRFPLAYSQPVTEQARERQIDPAVVYGLIRRESAFDPSAKSPAGALGLMQLMPATGETVARRLNEAWQSERSLLDPGLNVRYGTAYLRGLVDRFGGHLALAAAGYNAGPGRAERWRPLARTVPADVWIEAIPFNETRQYVSAVLSYAAIYRQRLGSAVRISDFLPEIAPGNQAETRPDRPMPVAVCR
jgi:soluble lytic murein transglycosylase